MNRLKNLTTLLCVTLFALISTASVNGQNQKFHSAAPESSWIYSYWNYTHVNDANSKNNSERLLSEPDVQAFVNDMIKRVGLTAPAMMLDQPEAKQKLMRSLGPKIADILFKGSGSFFLEDVEFDAKQGPTNIQAMLMLDAGAESNTLVEDISQLMTLNNLEPTKVELSGRPFVKFKVLDEPSLEVVIGAVDGTLMVASGEKTVSETLQRIANSQKPAWLSNFKTHKNVARFTNFSYFNVGDVLESFAPAMDQQTMLAIGWLGLGNVDSIETCTGFSDEQAVSRMFIRTDGDPEGLLDLSASSGLSLDNLKAIPKDSLFAMGVSLDAKRLFSFVQSASRQLGSRNDLIHLLNEVKRETEIDLSEEIENFDDTWTLHNGASDGWLSGLVATANVKSGQQLSAAIDQVIKKIIIETEGRRYAPRFSKRKFGPDEIYSVSSSEFPIFQPSWSISGDQIYVGLFPQSVETALRPDKYETLVDQSLFDKMSKSFTGATESRLIGFGYGDTETQFPISYPYVQIAMNMTEQLVREINLPGAYNAASKQALEELAKGIRLPAARSIHKHLGPSYLMARRTNNGIEIESSQTIPSLDPGFIAPVAVGVLLPAVQQTRDAARSVVSKNNLRQLALAAHNFESAHQAFPAGYSINEKEEKLLSWRVHILPFLEQNHLYEQFKLDEPWDSPHNKQLIEKMPETFRSPVSNAASGKTVYRCISGDMQNGGILLAPKRPNSASGAIGFGQIRDGSSNTILLVETNDSLAQEWTKPDEGLDYKEVDTKGIFGAYPKGTNVAMADGAVHLLLDSVPVKTISQLMQRNDGSIVRNDEVFQSNNRRRRNRRRPIETPVDPFFVIDNGSIELSVDNMLNDDDKKELAQLKELQSLREITLAMHNFQSAHRAFPSAYTTDDQGKPLLSWRVHILPFLNEHELYNQFNLREPWDSEQNKPLLSKMPEIYNFAEGKVPIGTTTVLANGGPGGIVSKPPADGPRSNMSIGFGGITDGSANTLLMLTAPDNMAVEWTKPTEFVPNSAIIKSLSTRKTNAAFSDGSAKQIRKGISLELFEAILTRNGGEVFSHADLK